MNTIKEKLQDTLNKYEKAKEVYDSENEAIGAEARLLRVKYGVSLNEVARRMGVSNVFLSDLERGRRRWQMKHIGMWERAMFIKL